MKHLRVLVISSALLSPGVALAQSGQLSFPFGTSGVNELQQLNNAISTLSNRITPELTISQIIEIQNRQASVAQDVQALTREVLQQITIGASPQPASPSP